MLKPKLDTVEMFDLTTGVLGHLTDVEQLEYIRRYTEARINSLTGEAQQEIQRLKMRISDLKLALGDGAGWFDRFKYAEKERDEARTKLADVEQERDEALEQYKKPTTADAMTTALARKLGWSEEVNTTPWGWIEGVLTAERAEIKRLSEALTRLTRLGSLTP